MPSFTIAQTINITFWPSFALHGGGRLFAAVTSPFTRPEFTVAKPYKEFAFGNLLVHSIKQALSAFLVFRNSLFALLSRNLFEQCLRFVKLLLDHTFVQQKIVLR